MHQGECVTVKDVLECMIKAHEIQGGLALLNSFNRNQVGLDHVVLVKVASKGLMPLARRARTASCVLESQVGTNTRVRVQQNVVFVLWGKISFDEDSNSPSNPQCRCRAVVDVAVARMGLPHDFLRAVGD